MLDVTLLAASILLMSAAQVLQKTGMARVTPGRWPLLRPFAQPLVLAGLVCHATLTLLWLVVLTRVPVSVAFPVLSLSFVVIVLYSRAAMHEFIPRSRWAGVGLIVSGVSLLAYGAAR